MSPEKLVYMANQIATFFAAQPEADRAGKVAEHLRAFWEPRMRAELVAFADAGGAGLDPLVREAVERLRTAA